MSQAVQVETIAAVRICDAFRNYNNRFREVTRRAARHFETRNWTGAKLDAVRRIDLYQQSVVLVLQDLQQILGTQFRDRDAWGRIKVLYTGLIAGCDDREFYQTFFSSVSRRVFDTVGVDPLVEFLAADVEPGNYQSRPLRTRRYRNRGSLRFLFDEILADLPFARRFRDIESTLGFITAEVEACLAEQGRLEDVDSIELIVPLFYRGQRAYLVGRLLGKGWQIPLVIPFKHADEGILCDAVILSEREVSILFGFTRSYFHADLPVVGSAVEFLKKMLPEKPVAELYTVLGRARQGKTERYRALMQHLAQSTDLFEHARGETGMVMEVFTLPSFNLVFKVIRDRFAPPKTVRREEVREKYELVFRHDRAGRLVDAQEFRRLSFDVGRFSGKLLESLLESCSMNCRIDGDQLLIEHLYVERRLTPLNIYLREAPAEDAAHAVIDYGQAIRDLASSNIFAGDLLPKNFGVTRRGRVIFYDYDEVCRITDCRFRDFPRGDDVDEMRAGAWFYVAPNDVFPEQFIQCIGLSPELRGLFRRLHGELLTASWWTNIRARLARGETIDVLPYALTSRVTRVPGAGHYAAALHKPAEPVISGLATRGQ
ncbi:MAG TPA: bifunctional isocitrate dehydrogenase kinase/phosphatase [Woeseiaceae bacterium]|nr:bifunctional isocitrate dehydrogenase kinase/phosphatase [Woeseiaceae bacterium]